MIEQLAAEAHRFDTLQAVGLIERLVPGARSVGEGANPADEAVRFQSNLTTAFPASDLDAAIPPGPGERQWTVLVNFLGLAGGFGPLPPPFTEAIIQQVRDGDLAARDFLDIFNHRLVSLLCRARRMHRPALHPGTPDQGPMAHYLYSLIGLGTEGLHGRMSVPDRVLLKHAGVLAQQPRTLHGLECLLSGHFDVPVRAVPAQGRWLTLDSTQVTRLGRQNTVLGDEAVLGRRVWDQQAAVTVELGPLTLAAFRAFLPGGRAAHALRDLARFYLGPRIEVAVRLRLAPDQVPATRLAGAARRQAEDAPRLGWTSWLTTRRRTAEGVVQPQDTGPVAPGDGPA